MMAGLIEPTFTHSTSVFLNKSKPNGETEALHLSLIRRMMFSGKPLKLGHNEQMILEGGVMM
jgi:hypothetical protein